jgi:hypothetical protein
LVVIAAGAGSAGGLATVVVKKVRRKAKPPTEAERVE